MLATNIVSHFVRRQSLVDAKVVALPMETLCISAVTEAELRFGLTKRPGNKTLAHEVNEFLSRVEALPWDRNVAPHYARLRAETERQGKSLAPLDLLIAAHALAAGATLVTNDTAFAQIPGLPTEDWTQP
jgi:tRNA(fMet)-specific endonuclease VapC